jgi:hypothetical protein
MKAIIENNQIKDIAHSDPFAIFTPDVAALYETDVPDTANVGDVLVDGTWVTPEEREIIVNPDSQNEAAERVVRMNRDTRLLESDWTQLPDSPVDSSVWATYRQALRDITTHANFPNLEESDWPVAP